MVSHPTDLRGRLAGSQTGLTRLSFAPTRRMGAGSAIFEKRSQPELRYPRQRFSSRDRMRIRLCSVVVDDQQRALDFYTGTLGFLKSQDFPVGEFRWIT